MIEAIFRMLLTDKNMQHILAAEKKNTKGSDKYKEKKKKDSRLSQSHISELKCENLVVVAVQHPQLSLVFWIAGFHTQTFSLHSSV